METLTFILLILAFIKNILGYAYFDFYQFYKRGQEYVEAHSDWMLHKP